MLRRNRYFSPSPTAYTFTSTQSQTFCSKANIKNSTLGTHISRQPINSNSILTTTVTTHISVQQNNHKSHNPSTLQQRTRRNNQGPRRHTRGTYHGEGDLGHGRDMEADVEQRHGVDDLELGAVGPGGPAEQEAVYGAVRVLGRVEDYLGVGTGREGCCCVVRGHR